MFAKYVKEMNLPKIAEGGSSPRVYHNEPMPNRFTRNHERHRSLNVNKVNGSSP